MKIKPVVTYRGNRPELVRLAMLLNLAGGAYQDKDLKEQYLDVKKEMSVCAGTQNGQSKI